MPSQVELVRGQDVVAKQAGDSLTGGKPGALTPLEVAGGQGTVRLVVERARDRLWQLDQRAGQRPVDRLGTLRRRSLGDVEEQRPVDAAVPDRAEADEVREDRVERPVRLQLVELPDLRVAVAICGIGELDRDERLSVRAVVARPGCVQVVDQLRADQTGEELIDDQPLVVSTERAPRLVEELVLRDTVLA